MIAAANPTPPPARAQPPKGKPPREEHFACAMKEASAPEDKGKGKARAPNADGPPDAADQAQTAVPDAAPIVTDATALAAAQAMLAAMAGATIPAKTAPAAAVQSEASANASPTAATASPAPAKAARSAAGSKGDDPLADPVAVPVARFVDAQRAVAAAAGGDAAPTSAPAPAPASAPAEIMVAHHLDLARDGAWLDGLARDIARSADTNGHLRFTLAPEHLGRLDVRLSADADGTAIRLTTETREAHRIVADAQPRLVAEARAQGLRVSDTQVDLDQRQSGASQAFGNQNGGGGRQPRRPAAWSGPAAIAGAAVTAAGAGHDDLYA